MTRTKNFSREEVLEKSMPVFWRKGFASTSLRDLENATGVNKSGLYSEFKHKEDIYLASLAYYSLTRGAKEILEANPLGWSNIEQFLHLSVNTHQNQNGCFITFSMRDYTLFSAAGRKNIFRHLETMRNHILYNLRNEKTDLDPEQLADMIVMFFSGLTLLQNSSPSANPKANSKEAIRVFVDAVKKL